MTTRTKFERAEPAGPRTPGEPFHVQWRGCRVAVLERGDGAWAFEDRCPHMGASLLLGDRFDRSIVCPWHGWKFDLETGACANSDYARLRVLEVELRGDDVWLRPPADELG